MKLSEILQSFRIDRPDEWSMDNFIERAKQLEDGKSKAVDDLKDLLKVQCSDGNWNYAPYMHGMANGMILAVALMEDKEPEFLDAPEVWGMDKPDPTEPTTSGGSE